MSLSSNFPAIKPSLLLDFANTKQLDPRITFTRSTTATYYDGVTTAMAEQNLFTSSQAFAAWQINGATLTTGVTDPAGGTTAATVTKTANNAWSLRQDPAVNTRGTTFTMSFYLKGSGTVTFRADNYIDQALTQQVTLSATWTRYSFTFTFNNNGNQTVGAFGIGMTSGDTATSFDVAFAQLEYRSSATAYTATTTQAITNYIPVLLTAAAGVPRFDHNPVTDESLGLLIEEARTNLYINSAAFSGPGWGIDGTATITANTYVAPDGTLSADTLNCFANGDSTYQVVNLTNGVTYTGSVYVKYVSGNTDFRVQVGGTSFSSGDQNITFNSQTGALVSNPNNLAYTVTSVGNGWYRIAVTRAATASGNSYWDFNANAASQFALWGAQLEAGAFATSYIPTTTAQVTRNADAASMTGTNFSSWYSAAEGTLYADFVITRTGSNDMSAAIIQGANTNDSIYIYAQPQNSRFRGDVFVGGTAQCAFAYTAAGAPTSGTPYKAALAYKVNDFAMSINAATVSTDTSGTVPVVDRMAIGATAAVATLLNGTVKKIAYYPLRLTNAQLQALTS